MNIKKILLTAGNLVIFCFVVGLTLAMVNNVTEPKIQANARKAMEEVQKQLLPADKYVELDGFGENVTVYKAMKDEKFTGYIVSTSSVGYSSRIVIMYSISPDYKVEGVNIVSQQETPGLGTRIEEDVNLKQFDDRPFVAQFNDKGVDQLYIGNAKDFNDKNIAAITGTTISSEAVTKGIHDSLEDVIDVLKSGKAKPRPDAVEKKPDKTGWLDRVLKVSPVYAQEDNSMSAGELCEFFPGDDYVLMNGGLWVVTKEKSPVGILSVGEAKGYNGNISVAVALTPDENIKNVMLYKTTDDAEYINKLKQSSFLNKFRGKNKGNLNVDTITGATYSSKGFIEAVKDALKKAEGTLNQ
ncbi:MAG: RnfABCDGE type electron transport complex subunit G [Vulcanimicrobiota bacterium]